jgi:hypothetical protein
METYDKLDQLRKLRLSANIVITGNEITTSDDIKIYKKNALEYGKKLRGVYTNYDTQLTVRLGVNALKEILHHDSYDPYHLQSIQAIPQFIRQAIFIDHLTNENICANPGVLSFDYYAVGLIINKIHFTVKVVVAIDNQGSYRYYDHKLTTQKKDILLDEVAGITSPRTQQEVSSLSRYKDIRLINILQIIQ